MKTLVNYFIKFPIAADLLILLICILGSVSMLALTTSRFPAQESKTIVVETRMNGAASGEIESGITIKIENAIQGISGITKFTSTSQENLSRVDVTVQSKADKDAVLRDVKNAVDGINSFPQDADQPLVFLQERKDRAASIALVGTVNFTELKQIAEEIKQEIIVGSEVADVTFRGYRDAEIEISLSTQNLNRYNLTFQEVASAISEANLDLTAGTLEMNGEEHTLRAFAKRYHAKELGQIVVKSTPAGGQVLLNDIATLEEAFVNGSPEIFLNGESAIILDVLTTSKQDISVAAETVHTYVESFNEGHANAQLSVLEDGSVVVQQRVDLLVTNGLIGMVLVFIVLGLFLNVRLAFWVALSIPVSMLGMFIVAPYFAVNINMFSLFGLILSLGILVDDGVVISENIYAKFEEGLPPHKAAWQGVKEVSSSVLIAVITTCLFFVIFFFVEGAIGDLVKDIGFTVIVILLVSLVEGFLILPAHIAHSKALQGKRKPTQVEKLATRFFEGLQNRLYQPALKFCLRNKMIAFSLFFVPLILMIALMVNGTLAFTFFPNVDEDVQSVQLEMPAGTTRERTAEVLSNIEAAVHTVNEALKAEREDGADVVLDYLVEFGNEENKATLTMYLLDGESRNMESFLVSNAVREEVGPLSEASYVKFGGASFFGAPVSITLTGKNIDDLQQFAHELVAGLEKYPELKNVQNDVESGGKEYSIELKPAAYASNISIRDVTEQLRFGILGYDVQTLQRGTEEVHVQLRYAREDVDSYDDLNRLQIKVNNNEYLLGTLAELTPVRNPKVLRHKNGRLTVTVTAEQVDPNQATPAILDKVEAELLEPLLAQTPGVEYDYGGQSESAKETIGSVTAVLPAILILVYFCVVINFRSFMQAWVVFLLIPFTFIGVAIGHLIHGVPISILSFFGIIAVLGVVINDSLVFVSRMNQLLQTGMSFQKALVKAGMTRFRPIVITSLTTIAGLIPLVFETSLQAKLLIPMAISLAYGLAAATFIMLLLLPVFLKSLNGINRWRYWIMTGMTVSEEAVEPSVKEMNRLKNKQYE